MNFLKFSKRFVRSIRFQQVQNHGKIYFYLLRIYFTKYFFNKSARKLFTVETLDLTGYQNNRQDAINNVIEANKFKWELQAYVENESELDAVRLNSALEVLVHLAQPEFEDVNLMKNTLYAYDSIDGVNEKAKRSIGNLVLKAMYSINLPDAALKVKMFSVISRPEVC